MYTDSCNRLRIHTAHIILCCTHMSHGRVYFVCTYIYTQPGWACKIVGGGGGISLDEISLKTETDPFDDNIRSVIHAHTLPRLRPRTHTRYINNTRTHAQMRKRRGREIRKGGGRHDVCARGGGGGVFANIIIIRGACTCVNRYGAPSGRIVHRCAKGPSRRRRL